MPCRVSTRINNFCYLQVRRLSERGGEGSGPSPIEQAFLATLSQAPAPQPGARRHSVVTISRVPQNNTLFGRNRRESIAAFATGMVGKIFKSLRDDLVEGLTRRDSGTFQSRGSLSGQGSQFNLQLDIMDDIAEAKAKAKGKRKTSWTPAPPQEEQPKPSTSTPPRRRASELPSLTFSPAGIVCTNSDLINLLSPLTSSAGEVGAGSDLPQITVNPHTGSPTQPKPLVDKRRRFLKDRSNSFDISALPTSSWFAKRHQPLTFKQKNVVVTFVDEKPKSSIAPQRPKSPEASKVVWDDRSGSVIDANIIGSAIEVFLNRRSSQGPESPKSPSKSPKKTPWLVATKEDAPEESICSTLKDLFVK